MERLRSSVHPWLNHVSVSLPAVPINEKLGSTSLGRPAN